MIEEKRENLFPSTLVIPKGHLNMNPEEREIYIKMLNKCPLIKKNGSIVTMK